jgi:carbon storage regulator
MLVLSRSRFEQIVIGSDVIVTIVDVRGDKVKLGIEAPTSIPVHRREVFDRILRGETNRRSTNATTDSE